MLKDLCQETLIRGIVRIYDKIYVFSNTKYWIFDTHSSDVKPFGNLIEGNQDIREKYNLTSSFDFSKASYTIINKKIFIASGEKYASFKTNGELDKLGKINHDEKFISDENELDVSLM